MRTDGVYLPLMKSALSYQMRTVSKKKRKKTPKLTVKRQGLITKVQNCSQNVKWLSVPAKCGCKHAKRRYLFVPI